MSLGEENVCCKPQTRVCVEQGTHKAGTLLENATMGACLGWAGKTALGQGPPRELQRCNLSPFSVDSALMHIYFRVCIQTCGVSGTGLGEGKQMWPFLGSASEAQRKMVYFLHLAQMDRACGLLALAAASGPVKGTMVLSPRTCADCHAFLPNWLSQSLRAGPGLCSSGASHRDSH